MISLSSFKEIEKILILHISHKESSIDSVESNVLSLSSHTLYWQRETKTLPTIIIRLNMSFGVVLCNFRVINRRNQKNN